MTSNVHIVNSQNVSGVLSHTPALHNGSVVKGTVVSVQGQNSYTVNVAGQNINVRSDVALKPGTNFTAKLLVGDNLVTLKLIQTASTASTLTTLNLSSLTADNSAVMNLLHSLGLPASTESLKLVQFALNMGIKLDSAKLTKAFKRTKSHNGGEEKAQISLLVDEKGLTSTPAAVEKIYGKSWEHSHQQNQSQQQNKKETEQQKQNAISEEDIIDYFQQVDEAALKKNGGIISLFNSVLPVNRDEGHWIVLPFEWDEKKINGVIRVFLKVSEKNTSKVIVDCCGCVKKYYFVLYLNKGKISRLLAGFTGSEKFDQQKLTEQLTSLFDNKPEVTILPVEELNGFLTENVELSLFQGEA